MQNLTSTLTTITDDNCTPWFVNHSLVFCPQMEMNRSELQDNMIQQILEDMDIKTMMAILYDNMSESYDKYSDEELITEVKEYYPELLEE